MFLQNKIHSQSWHNVLKSDLFAQQKSTFQLTDISSQHIFYLFLLKSAFNDELVVSVYGATAQKGQNVKTINLWKNIWNYAFRLIYSLVLLQTLAIVYKQTYLVPNSANRNARRCLGWRCKLQRRKRRYRFKNCAGGWTWTNFDRNNLNRETHSLQMSVKLTKEVFLVPTRTTCGGFITNFLFSPATMSGFFSLMMLKTLFRSWNKGCEDYISDCKMLLS